MDAWLLLPLATFTAVFAASLLVVGRVPTVALRLSRHDPLARPTARPMAAGGRRKVRETNPSALRATGEQGRVGRAIVGNTKGEVRDKAALLLQRAGSRMSVGSFLVLRTVMMVVVGPLFALLAIVGFGITLPGLGAAGLALLVSPRLPTMWLESTAKKRGAEIERGLPDALDLLVVCVEGGLSLDGALMQVANRMHGVVAQELGKLQRDIAAGMGRRDAFLALAARSPSESLAQVCSAIMQADKMGMSIASTLRSLTETMRTRRRQAAEEQANKAPIKMMPVLVVFMIPSLFAVILGQAVMAFMSMD